MARKRKAREEEHENHERWLVSYADFITLLFAFFVVMYAISSVNEGKYRVLSNSLVAAFRDPARSLEPIQVGDLVRSPTVDERDPYPAPSSGSLPLAVEIAPEEPVTPAGDSAFEWPQPAEENPDRPVAAQEPLQDLESIATLLLEGLQPLIDEELIELRREASWVEVEMKSSILFDSGSARLESDAVPVLAELARMFAEFGNPIRVEGFTDNVPIATLAFPSNWELSAARAASVVHLFSRLGVNPQRMSAVGYGEHRPVADNEDPEGRQRNRRVVIVIAADEQAKPLVDLQRLPEAEPQARVEPPGLAPAPPEL